MQHTLDVMARAMDGTVNGEAGRIDRPGAVAHLVALHVDLDQARSGDLVEHHAVRIDQEMMLGSGHRGLACARLPARRHIQAATLNGEGLQHEDGHGRTVLASVVPNCVSYDPLLRGRGDHRRRAAADGGRAGHITSR